MLWEPGEGVVGVGCSGVGSEVQTQSLGEGSQASVAPCGWETGLPHPAPRTLYLALISQQPDFLFFFFLFCPTEGSLCRKENDSSAQRFPKALPQMAVSGQF